MIKITKLYGGDSKSEAPKPISKYDATSDPGYIESTKFLETLKPEFDKANHKMTAAEIIATLPAMQQQLINNQKMAPVAAKGANWGAINNRMQQPAQQPMQAIYAPQYQRGLFNGPQSVDPSSLQTPAQNFAYLAGLLGSAQNGGK